jgi:cell division protein FtsB
MDLRVGLPKLRILPSPEDRLRTLTHGADWAEQWTKQLQARVMPFLQQMYIIRRRLATGTVAILTVWLFLHVMFGANGMAVYRAKRGEYQNLQKEIGGLDKENQQYTQEVNELKSDPQRIEKEAREQFHYARPGEVVYVSPEPPAPEQPATHSARR